MQKRTARFITLIGIILLIFLAPIAWSAFSPNAYFYDYPCTCGYDVFMYLNDGGYWHFCPGHGTREQIFTVRPKQGGWDVYQNNENISELRISYTGLYERFKRQTTWSWHPRIYNIWRVWIGGVLRSENSQSYPMRVSLPTNSTTRNDWYSEMRTNPTTEIQTAPLK